MHAKEQDLECPGCNKQFVRLGGLIHHLEIETCHALPSENMEAARKAKEQANAAVRAAHDFMDFTRSGPLFGEGPHPLGMKISGMPQQEQQPEAAILVPIPAPPPPLLFEGDNLIGLEVLNLPWDVEEEVSKDFQIMADEFPALNDQPPNIMDTVVLSAPAGSTWPAWTVEKDLFPVVAVSEVDDVAAAVEEKIEEPQVEQHPEVEKEPRIENTLPDPEPNPHDPSHPRFDTRHYWIPFFQKFKCPYLACG